MEKLIFKFTVDDYEHDGDTQNEINSWKGLGLQFIKTHHGDEPGDAPENEFSFVPTPENVKSVIEKLERKIHNLRGARHKDYSSIQHPSVVQGFVEEIDQKAKTKYAQEYKDKFEQLNNLYESF